VDSVAGDAVAKPNHNFTDLQLDQRAEQLFCKKDKSKT